MKDKDGRIPYYKERELLAQTALKKGGAIMKKIFEKMADPDFTRKVSLIVSSVSLGISVIVLLIKIYN